MGAYLLFLKGESEKLSKNKSVEYRLQMHDRSVQDLIFG